MADKAFQSCAFQVHPAFQADQCGGTPRVGWYRGYRRRGRTFEECEEAEKVCLDRSAEVKKRKYREALATAARLAASAREEIAQAESEEEARLIAITEALRAAAGATKLSQSLIHARQAQDLANAVLRGLEQDEEECCIELLL